MEGFKIEETPSFVHRISTTTEVVRIRRHALAEGRLPLSLAEESLDRWSSRRGLSIPACNILGLVGSAFSNRSTKWIWWMSRGWLDFFEKSSSTRENGCLAFLRRERGKKNSRRVKKKLGEKFESPRTKDASIRSAFFPSFRIIPLHIWEVTSFHFAERGEGE